MRFKIQLRAALLCLLLLQSISAAAAYTIVDLHPAGYTSSTSAAMDGGNRIGRGDFRAGYWKPDGNFVDLHPTSGYSVTWGTGISGDWQVGLAQTTSGTMKALLWTGSAGSVVDLAPSAGTAQAWGIAGEQIVGTVNVRGAIWNGPTHTLTTFNIGSFIENTNGVQQVGFGGLSGFGATLWTGTSASAVKLHPTGADWSVAWNLDDDRQIGGVVFDGSMSEGPYQAVLWNDTAASAVILHPAGMTETFGYAVSSAGQVGYGYGTLTGGETHALLWHDTAASMIDLHQFLPAGYTSSTATDIDEEGNIFGHAMIGGTNHAVMWVVPEPSASLLFMLCGAGILWRRRY